MKAILALEDGTCYEGVGFGAPSDAGGEVVFNTSMTGYQEILTDPSYAGQIVTMTAAEIGNYGVNTEDVESVAPQVAGFVVRDAPELPSNWRATASLHDYLVEHRIAAIAGIDTRALTRKLRTGGVLRGVIACGDVSRDGLVERARAVPPMEGADLVSGVTCPRPWTFPRFPAPDALEVENDTLILAPGERASRPLRVAAYDFGIKLNLLRRLAAYGCETTVYPATTPPRTLLDTRPDGIFLSNGPGDPAALGYVVEHVRELVDADIPLFGVCLGHQLLALALGGRTYKLKFGHRGGNHPVCRLATGRVEITSQNHGFAVDPATLPSSGEVTHVNLYDRTVEGLRHVSRPAFSVQYHPEASPGPHDADYLFGAFVREMEKDPRAQA